MTYLERVKTVKSFSKPRKQLHIAILSIIRSNGKITAKQLYQHFNSNRYIFKICYFLILLTLCYPLFYTAGYLLSNNVNTRYINNMFSTVDSSVFSNWHQHFFNEMKLWIALSNKIGLLFKAISHIIISLVPVISCIMCIFVVVHAFSFIFIKLIKQSNTNDYYKSFELNLMDKTTAINLLQQSSGISAYLFNNCFLLFNSEMNYLGAIKVVDMPINELKQYVHVIDLNVLDTDDNKHFQINNLLAYQIVRNYKRIIRAYVRNSSYKFKLLHYSNFGFNKYLILGLHCLFAVFYIFCTGASIVAWYIFYNSYPFHRNFIVQKYISTTMMNYLRNTLFTPVFVYNIMFVIMTLLLIVYVFKIILQQHSLNQYQSVFPINSQSLFNLLNNLYYCDLNIDEKQLNDNDFAFLLDQYVLIVNPNMQLKNVIPYSYFNLNCLNKSKVIDTIDCNK